MTHLRTSSAVPRRAGGFSLVELFVSATILLIMVYAGDDAEHLGARIHRNTRRG